MNEYRILPLQIQALREDLRHIENTLNRLQSDLHPQNPSQPSNAAELLDRVRPRLDYLIKTNQTELDNIESRIANDGLQPSDGWLGLRNVRQECKRLFQACLALIEGALVRQHGLDNGLCRIADALLDELNLMTDVAWRRFTIWADRESFANIDEVIRLRFPSTTIWHLPVAAHEFGHFVSDHLEEPGTRRQPFKELCEDYRENPEARFLPEYFSDMFATYTVGPSYAYACVMLRFDQGAANYDAEKHPSAAKRLHAVLRTLEKMDHGSSPPQFTYICNELGRFWREGVTAAFQQADLDEDATEELDNMLDGIYDILANDLPPGVRYKGWLRAQQLSAVLLSGDERQYKLQQLRNNDTIVDIVNAAWLSRIPRDNPYEVRDISTDALAMCKAVLARKGTNN